MKIDVIGVPMYYGSDRPGVEQGPDRLRAEGLLPLLVQKGNEVVDLGNVPVPLVDADFKYASHPKMKFLKEILTATDHLADAVESSLRKGRFPLVVGGDHALALGSLAGVHSALGADTAVIWIDAHADLNTEAVSPSGNVHGMPLGASLGFGADALTQFRSSTTKVQPERVFLLGLRSVDAGEEDIIAENGLHTWRMEDIRSRGMDTVIDELLRHLEQDGIRNIHLSYDIDSLDDRLVPGTGTPVADGMEYEESRKLMRAILKTGKVRSMDFVEFNPVRDQEDQTLESCLVMLDEVAEALGTLE